MTIRSRFIALAFAGALLMLSACSESHRKSVSRTSGKIVGADGKPVAGATIMLHPTVDSPDASAHKPAARTDETGAFKLTTYEQDDGAPAGDYIATVEVKAIPKSLSDNPPDQLKGKFSNPKTSTLKVTVPSSGGELAPITLP